MPSIKQITTKLYKHYSGVADTRTSRDFFEEALESSFSVRPDQLWMYGDQIPRPESREDEAYKKLKNFKDGEILAYEKDESTFIPVLIKHIDWPLAKIDNGTDNSFKLIDYEYTEIRERDENGKAKVTRKYDLSKPTSDIPVNIIPFNFASDLYNYSLSTKDGKRIYFGVGDWQLDIFSGVLTFYGDVPEGVDHNNPPRLTFYQYIGGTGFRQDTYGFDGATLPIDNWHIDKGQYVIKDNPNNEIVEIIEGNPEKHNETLFETIGRISNKVEDGFSGTYGWDGNDKNEGIALSLEKIIALEYTFTKDKVKGYDDSADAEIGTLLSNKHATTNAPLAVTFVSQGLKDGDHILSVTNDQISFDNGKAKTIKEGIHKLPNKEGNGFIVVEITEASIPAKDYNVSVAEVKNDVVALLLYWNKTTQEYLPFKTKEEHDYNFGFSIVAANGKIPPSVKMDSAAISAYSDSITPDYYGPRNYSVTVAVEGEFSTKSADYVVKNNGTFYLDDIINRIAEDFTETVDDVTVNTFKGTIFLRAGTYKLRNNLDLSKFDNVAILGESQSSVIISGNNNYRLTYNNSSETEGLVLLKGFTLDDTDLNFNSKSKRLVIRDVISNGDLETNSHKNNILITDSSFQRSVTIKNDADLTKTPIEDVSVVGELLNSIFGSLFVDASNVFIDGVVAYSSSFEDRKDVFVKSCFFQEVTKKPTQVQLRGCTVRRFSIDINRREIPNIGAFPIFSKTNDQLLQYAKFANQFYYSEANNDITLNIDGAYLYWKTTDDNGDLLKDAEGNPKVELSCHLDAGQIKVRNPYRRDENYYMGGGVDLEREDNLDAALEEIYKTKADLVKGKVPLTELPDSVAYGGLLYIGTWGFDENGGKYPTFKDQIVTHPHLSLDFKVDGLQPGWFWVVSDSKYNQGDTDIDNPVSDQPSALQYTFDETTGLLKVLATSLDANTVALLERLTKEDVDRILSDNPDPNPDSGSGSSGSDSGSDTDPSGSDDSGSDSENSGSDDSGSDSGSSDADVKIARTALFTTNLSEEDRQYKDWLTTGGLVFTAGDWLIWNGSFFEKLDRAYQDPIYSILPVYTTGTNNEDSSGRISWYWKTDRNDGTTWDSWGLGALDLSKKTIGEAFDNINVELKRLQVKHPANICDLSLTPVKDYLKTKYRSVVNFMISDKIEEDYDILLDSSISRFRVETPNNTDWKSLVYFGDSGKITGYVDKEWEEHPIDVKSEAVHLTTDEESGKIKSLMNISAPIDPYKDEFTGEGYWKGVNLDLGPSELKPFTEGEHSFQVGVSNVTPKNLHFMKNVEGMTSPFIIKIIKPYELTNAEVDSVVGRTVIDSSSIEKYELAGACSGVKSIKIKDRPVHISLTYRIKNALDNKVNIDNDLLIKYKTNINKDLKTPEFSIVPSIDGTRFLDYYMLNSDLVISSSKVWTNLSYDTTIYDVYGREKEFKNIINYNIRFDPTKEGERVFSGNELYPVYTPGKRNVCGNADWDSTKLLTQGVYISELQKVGRNITMGEEETTIAEYQWPSGIYKEFDENAGTNYSNVDTGVEIDGKTYRFVTLTKFGNSEDDLREIFLSDNSGFTLTFNVAEDNLENWESDQFSMSTKDLIIQAKVINPNIMETDPSYTKWIDCNSPYDGFSTVGDDDGDPGMYAGSSTATVKRITFGRRVYSGKLIIRVGIAKDSNIKFKNITIGDLI